MLRFSNVLSGKPLAMALTTVCEMRPPLFLLTALALISSSSIAFADDLAESFPHQRSLSVFHRLSTAVTGDSANPVS